MKPSWFELTQQRIKRNELTEPQIRYLRLRLREALNDNAYRHCTNDQAHALIDLIEARGTAVQRVQAIKGADWLLRLAFTKAGKQRSTAAAREFRDTDLQTLRMCAIEPRFALIGFDEHYSHGGRYLVHLAPIYRCFGRDGMFFDYVASAWQSGGAFAIVQHAYWPTAKVAA